MPGVLVGVDRSDSARRAAEEAVRLATALGAPLHIVTAIKSTHGGVVSGAGRDSWEVSGVTVAEDMLREVASSVAPGVSYTTAVVEGSPAEALVQEAVRVGADVIVVGSKNMQGVRRFLGAIANDVAHTAPCSVYIAKTV
jgi:nucleotide-binding universal stress UspA family protein